MILDKEVKNLASIDLFKLFKQIAQRLKQVKESIKKAGF